MEKVVTYADAFDVALGWIAQAQSSRRLTMCEPNIDDTVHACPECDRPNQFGELCESCRADIERDGNTRGNEPIYDEETPYAHVYWCPCDSCRKFRADNES